jgi:tetratricopeptide (TPR) repeat protein
MKKTLSIFVLSLSLLVFENMASAKTPIDACQTFSDSGDYKRAIEAGKLAVKKYPKDAEAYFCLGKAYYNVGELELAYKNLKKAEGLTNNKKGLMYIYNKIGQVLNNMGKLDDALSYYNRSLSLARELGDTYMQASVLNNIAYIFDLKGESNKAIGYYEESLSLTTNEKDKAPTYNNIAMIYYTKGDYQKAVEYFQKAIEIDEKYGNYHGVSILKLNLGNTYRKMEDYENAEKYLSEGLEGVKRVSDKYWVATGCRYSGWFLKDKGDKKGAKEYYNLAYKLYKSIGAEGYAQSVLDDIKELDKSK